MKLTAFDDWVDWDQLERAEIKSRLMDEVHMVALEFRNGTFDPISIRDLDEDMRREEAFDDKCQPLVDLAYRAVHGEFKSEPRAMIQAFNVVLDQVPDLRRDSIRSRVQEFTVEHPTAIVVHSKSDESRHPLPAMFENGDPWDWLRLGQVRPTANVEWWNARLYVGAAHADALRVAFGFEAEDFTSVPEDQSPQAAQPTTRPSMAAGKRLFDQMIHEWKDPNSDRAKRPTRDELVAEGQAAYPGSPENFWREVWKDNKPADWRPGPRGPRN